MHVFVKSCNRNFCQYLLSCVRAVCMSSEIGVKIDYPIIVRRFQFLSLGAGGLPFSLSPAPESPIQLHLSNSGYLTYLMRAARNLPLDSRLKFSILLAVPSCCAFTMLHYIRLAECSGHDRARD